MATLADITANLGAHPQLSAIAPADLLVLWFMLLVGVAVIMPGGRKMHWVWRAFLWYPASIATALVITVCLSFIGLVSFHDTYGIASRILVAIWIGSAIFLIIKNRKAPAPTEPLDASKTKAP